MKYVLAITVLLAGAIFPFALDAQSFPSAHAPEAVVVFHDGGPGFRPFLSRERPVVFPPFFGYPSNYPFEYFYPGLWPPLDYEYQQASRIAHGDVAGEVAAQEKALLSRQVQKLTDEVRSMRQTQVSPRYEQAPSVSPGAPHTASRAGQKFPTTVFVYRDGREMEVRDYAIFGNSLWVFHDQTVRKFPLADFNLEASRQINEEHGVEFPLSHQD